MPAFINKDGAAVEVFRGLPFVDRDGISRPANWLEVEPPEVIAAAGIVEIAEPPAPPEGKIVAPGPMENRDGVPTRSYTLEDAPAPQPDPVPETISDRQFAQALAKMDPPVITQAEALAFVKRGEVPAALQTVIDGVDDADQRFDLEMAVAGATTFDRTNPSTVVLAAALRWTPAQMDDLWRFAATIR